MYKEYDGQDSSSFLNDIAQEMVIENLIKSIELNSKFISDWKIYTDEDKRLILRAIAKHNLENANRILGEEKEEEKPIVKLR